MQKPTKLVFFEGNNPDAKLKDYFSYTGFSWVKEAQFADYVVWGTPFYKVVSSQHKAKNIAEIKAVYAKYGVPILVFYFGDFTFKPIKGLVFISYATNTKIHAQAIIVPYNVTERKEELVAISGKMAKNKLGFCGFATKRLIMIPVYYWAIFNHQKRFNGLLHFSLYPHYLLRFNALKSLQKKFKNTDFIIRKKYLGKAFTEKERLEFLENLTSNAYQVCIRGFGNFSVRFFEVLLAGRIPLAVRTEDALPFERFIRYNAFFPSLEFEDLRKTKLNAEGLLAKYPIEEASLRCLKLGLLLQNNFAVSKGIHRELLQRIQHESKP